MFNYIPERFRAETADTKEEAARWLAGDADGAIALLKESHEADPDNPRVTVALARARNNFV